MFEKNNLCLRKTIYFWEKQFIFEKNGEVSTNEKQKQGDNDDDNDDDDDDGDESQVKSHEYQQ